MVNQKLLCPLILYPPMQKTLQFSILVQGRKVYWQQVSTMGSIMLKREQITHFGQFISHRIATLEWKSESM